MSFNYFEMATKTLAKSKLSLDDLGEYSGRLSEFTLPVTELINPKTGRHYKEKERLSIRLARQYFREGRIRGGWDEAELERKKHLNNKQVEQEKKLAALGYNALEIAEKLGISKSKVYKDGFREWDKHGATKT